MKKISLAIFLAIVLQAAGYTSGMAKSTSLKIRGSNSSVSNVNIGTNKNHLGASSFKPNSWTVGAIARKKENRYYLKTRNLLTTDSSVYHLASLALLKAYNGAATTIAVDAKLQGGIFILHSGTVLIDSGITFPSAMSGKYWLRQIDYNYILPEWFGALGNGVHDDARYINEAIVAARKDSIGQVILRNVTYGIGNHILMEQGVSLTGSLQGATTNSDSTRTLILALSSLSSDAILYDFTDSTYIAPINSNLYNINIDMASHGGCGVHLKNKTTGNVLNGIQIVNVQVSNSTTYGFYNESNVNGVKYTKCYANNNGNHGFKMLGRDSQVDFCAGFNNNGDGLYTKGNSQRITNCDFWSNFSTDSISSGNGIEDDGYLNFYENVVSNINAKNGITLPTDLIKPYSGSAYFINCRVFDNGHDTTNKYSDIFIGSDTVHVGSNIDTTGKSVVITNSQLSYQASDASKKVAYSISTDNMPTQMVLSDNTFYTGGLLSNTSPSLSTLVQQYAVMKNNTRASYIVGNTPVTLPANGTKPTINQGSIFVTSNTAATTIRGFVGGQPGQHFKLIINDAFTSLNFGNDTLHCGNVANNNASIHFVSGAIIDFTCTDGTNYYGIVSTDLGDNVTNTAGLIPATNSVTNIGSSSSGFFSTFYGANVISNGNANLQANGTANSVLLRQGTTARLEVAPTTGNIILNGTVDSTNYRLQVPGRVKIQQFVAASSNDSLVAFNPATHGLRMTKLVAGAGVGLTYAAGSITLASANNLIVGTPTIAAGSGAGTSPTVSVTSNGKGLKVTITTGTGSTANATIATVTLANALPYTPYPVFAPANSATASLSGGTMVYMTSTGSTNVTITSGTTALAASTTYIWNITL
ncbi:MAG TPA: hypothetical protein VFE53_01755 [Mucilaginibacter sp.]|jgi:hypothetical protein|nr:hypothetical protein [Mucilaginibacter sp.]